MTRDSFTPRRWFCSVLIVAGLAWNVAGLFVDQPSARVFTLSGWAAIVLALVLAPPIPRKAAEPAGPQLVPDARALRHLYTRFDEYTAIAAPPKGERSEIAWMRLVYAMNRVRGLDGGEPETSPVLCSRCGEPAIFLATGKGSAVLLADEAEAFERTGLCAACRVPEVGHADH